MNNPNHPRLEFDKLIQSYMENLNVTLRSFTAAKGFEFLHAFVPSDDPTASILDVLDLAREAGIRQITLVVSPQTLARLQLQKLGTPPGSGRQRAVGDQTELEFSLV